ncbi:MAG: hypothetical protein U0736_02660 [Gemmataceae bacterium]
MRLPFRLWWLPLAAVLLPGVVHGEAAKGFKAGFAERDITPEIGAEAPGGYGKAYHRTLHDPCKVRAAVFDDGTTRVALVGLDALFIHRDTVNKVRSAIAKRTGMAETAILLGASHSHSSGPMSGVMPGEYDHASKLVQKLAYQDTTCADPKYLQKVEKAIIDAVCAAHDGRSAAEAGIGRGVERSAAFNRRFKMRDGRSVAPRPGQPRHRRAGRPDRPGSRGNRRVGREAEAAWLRRQLRLPRHHQPGRHLGELHSLSGKGDSGLLRQGRGGRLSERRIGRHHAGGQPVADPLPEWRPVGAAGRRQDRPRH